MPDDEDSTAAGAVDLRKDAGGESFTHMGYDCHIAHNGIRPVFRVDGDVVPLEDIEDAVGHVGEYPSAWKTSLKRYLEREVV